MIDPPGAGQSCDLRRRKVKQIVSELLDPKLAPLIEESVQFHRSETFEEKKRVIHRLEDKIGREDDERRTAIKRDGLSSHWNLDRIAAYIAIEHDGEPFDASASFSLIERELELVRADKGTPSFMALHYALRMSLKKLESGLTLNSENSSVLQRVLDDVMQEAQRWKSVRIEQLVERIRLMTRNPTAT